MIVLIVYNFLPVAVAVAAAAAVAVVTPKGAHGQ